VFSLLPVVANNPEKVSCDVRWCPHWVVLNLRKAAKASKILDFSLVLDGVKLGGGVEPTQSKAPADCCASQERGLQLSVPVQTRMTTANFTKRVNGACFLKWRGKMELAESVASLSNSRRDRGGRLLDASTQDVIEIPLSSK
jgi:hypothetical protein